MNPQEPTTPPNPAAPTPETPPQPEMPATNSVPTAAEAPAQPQPTLEPSTLPADGKSSSSSKLLIYVAGVVVALGLIYFLFL